MGFQALWVFKIFARAGLIPLKNPRKNKRREKRPAPVVGLIAAGCRESRKTAQKGLDLKDLADVCSGPNLGPACN
jgi:hypothetical protein